MRTLFACVNVILSYFSMCFTEAVVSSGRVEKSPHEQEIKFFAKVRAFFKARVLTIFKTLLVLITQLSAKTLPLRS